MGGQFFMLVQNVSAWTEKIPSFAQKGIEHLATDASSPIVV